MNQEAEKRSAAELAKTMAMFFVRNAHVGTVQTCKTEVARTSETKRSTELVVFGHLKLRMGASIWLK